jgi:hypothetical protein
MKQKPVPSLAGIDGEPRVRQQAYTSYGAVQRTDGPESPAAARMRDGALAGVRRRTPPYIGCTRPVAGSLHPLDRFHVSPK